MVFAEAQSPTTQFPDTDDTPRLNTSLNPIGYFTYGGGFTITYRYYDGGISESTIEAILNEMPDGKYIVTYLLNNITNSLNYMSFKAEITIMGSKITNAIITEQHGFLGTVRAIISGDKSVDFRHTSPTDSSEYWDILLPTKNQIYWYISVKLEEDIKFRIDESLKSYSDGWVKVDGVLRKIDSAWVKVDGSLKKL